MQGRLQNDIPRALPCVIVSRKLTIVPDNEELLAADGSISQYNSKLLNDNKIGILLTSLILWFQV